MSAASTMLGNFTNGGQIVEFAIQGALGIAVAYNTVGSPHATLRDCWETLCDIKTRLKAVTNERRQKIAAAAATRKCRSLADIESEFQNLWDAHAELSERYATSSMIQRHLPGELRSLIKRLDTDVKTLLVDTWTTTRAAQTLLSTLSSPRSRDQSNSMAITPADRATGLSNPGANRETIEMGAV